MNFLEQFSAFVRSVFQGEPFGNVYPATPPPVPTHIDGRTAALRLLRRYITELTFYRTGEMTSEATATTGRIYGAPVSFQFRPEDVLTEPPDGDHELSLPGIAVEGGNADYESIGIGGTYYPPETKDLYAPNTIVAWLLDYTERIKLEVYAASKAERRAIIIGLEQAFQPTEQAYLRFRMDDYYGQLCSFIIQGRTTDDSEQNLGRWKVSFDLDLNYTVCTLVNYKTLQPVVEVETTDPLGTVTTEVE